MRMLGRAIDAGVPAGWVTADEVYGQHSRLRMTLEDRGMPYVLAVAVNQRVITAIDDDGAMKVAELRVDALARMLPGQAWKRISAGAAAKGPREYHWARAAIRPLEDTRSHWLLVRRSPERAHRPRLLPMPRPRTHSTTGTDPGRWCPLGDRGDLPERQRPSRPGPVPGPPLRQLVPTHHPGHAGPRLPHRHHRRGRRKRWLPTPSRT